MKYAVIRRNRDFVGRKRELSRLAEIHSRAEASIIVVHGRRRVGKTELIEQFFRKDRVLKFEGLQSPPPKQNQKRVFRQRQIDHCVGLLADYAQDVMLSRLKIERWYDFFKLLTPYISERPVILYFEETQWLAAYQSDLFAEMKPHWDDSWRHNAGLRVVFAGSSPSFLKKQFMSDQALYNRSQYTIALEPFSPKEVGAYLKDKGGHDRLLAGLCIGGVPEYLRLLRQEPSVTMGLAKHSFRRDAPLLNEYTKIFVSSMAHSQHYQQVIEALAHHRFLSRSDLARRVIGKDAPGGSFSAVLDDLVQCGFIKQYSSVHLSNGRNLTRYRIADEYLWFYHLFIAPERRNIDRGRYEDNPLAAIDTQAFRVNLGFAFERWCMKNLVFLAEVLGFDQVEYDAGPYFRREKDSGHKGYQIDLVFIRKDKTLVFTECKYLNGPAGLDVVRRMDANVELFLSQNTKYRSYTIQKVLIAPQGAKNTIVPGLHVSRIVTLPDLLL